MKRRRAVDIEYIDYPRPVVDVAERRTHALIRAGITSANIIRTIALSCYLQGIADGFDVARAETKP